MKFNALSSQMPGKRFECQAKRDDQTSSFVFSSPFTILADARDVPRPHLVNLAK